MNAKCIATTKRGQACHNRARDGAAYCDAHDPDRAEERHAELVAKGRKGGEARASALREQWAELAEAVRVGSLEGLRALLADAARMATEQGDPAAMIRAVSIGNELLKTVDLEREVAEPRALVEARLGATGATVQ